MELFVGIYGELIATLMLAAVLFSKKSVKYSICVVTVEAST